MNLKIFFVIFFALCIYVVTYFYNREIKVSTYSVKVNYQGHGYREYVLDDPLIDAKAESGTYDIGKERSYLIRVYRPIEVLEVKFRFKVRRH